MKNILINLAVSALIIYAALALLAYKFIGKLVYFPSKVIELTPQSFGLHFEDISFRSSDNLTLHGWFIPAENQKATILFCHGNGGNISGRIDFVKILHELNLSTFIFDYPGYGNSEGKPTEQGTYDAVEAAYNYLTREKDIPGDSIIVLGRSLGGPIAAWLAKQKQVKALILHATFTSLSEMGEEAYPKYLIKILPKTIHYPTAEYMAAAGVPTLIVHSRDDSLIPVQFGKKLFEIAKEPKMFLEISGTHQTDFLTSEKEYKEGLLNFLESITDRK